ncbi:MAG: ComF family protein [Paramuribaculum sp.]|nr:ComF family protein [Paramuribaculum sp.]
MAVAEVIHRCRRALMGMLYPEVCEVCGRALVEGEEMLCLDCLAGMPLYSPADFSDTEIHRRLMRTPIVRAASLYYYYKDTPYAMLIQKAKYASRPKLARSLGRIVAERLKPKSFFDGIDAVTVVPLHKSKERRRGYNQSLMIARGVADVAGMPIVDLLDCSRHGTQTARTVWQRWANAESTYTATPDTDVSGLHILLIDDVITSGATLSACASALLSAHPSARISILTIGVATPK